MKIVINESQHKFLISELKYTDDDIRQEASKYQTSKEFQQNNSSGWQTAYKRKMLDDLFPNRKKNNSDTDDDIRQEASKYNSVQEFRKGSPKMFYIAFNRKMLDNLFPDRKIGSGRDVKYTDDDIRQEASKYQTSKEFQQNNLNMWQTAYSRKMLDDLFPDRKKNNSYTDDDIRQEASKYQTSKEFLQNNPSGWQMAHRRKILDDLFPNRKIGRGRDVKYTDDDIRQEASKYNSVQEFRKNNRSAWNIAFDRKMLDDFFPNRKKKNSYTDDDIRREASKYQTSTEFLQNNNSVWRMAYKRKMLDDLFPNKKIGGGRDVKYTDDDIRREASKYQTSKEFHQNNPSVWQTASNRKMLDDLFPDRIKGKGRTIQYTDDDIRQEASKYQTSKEFLQNNNSAWNIAYKRKMLDDLFPDRKKNNFHTDDDIRREASKYQTERDFRENNNSVWQMAYKRKMLDDLFPDRKKNKRHTENIESLKNIILENLKRQKLFDK